MIKLNGKEYELNEEKVLELLKREGLIKEDELVFSPKIGEEFWHVESDGSISRLRYHKFKIEYGLKNQNNMYKTKEEAEIKSQLNQSVFRLIENMMIAENIRTGWKADWENEKQIKYILCFNNFNKTWRYADYSYVYSCISTSEESAEKIAKYLNDNGIRP